MHIKMFEEELTTDKRLWVISNINTYATKKLKNKASSSLNNVVCITMWSLVM